MTSCMNGGPNINNNRPEDISPAVITAAISLLSILIEEYGLPGLQRWLDDNRQDEDDNEMELNIVASGQATDITRLKNILEGFSRQATEENIETSDAGIVYIIWKPKEDSFK